MTLVHYDLYASGLGARVVVVCCFSLLARRLSFQRFKYWSFVFGGIYFTIRPTTIFVGLMTHHHKTYDLFRWIDDDFDARQFLFVF